MEPEVKDFLTKVISSISMALLWLLINSTIGIGYNFAFFEGSPSTGNFIFYGWFLLSLFFLLRYLYNKWKA
jgi:hypothetical protein